MLCNVTEFVIVKLHRKQAALLRTLFFKNCQDLVSHERKRVLYMVCNLSLWYSYSMLQLLHIQVSLYVKCYNYVRYNVIGCSESINH